MDHATTSLTTTATISRHRRPSVQGTSVFAQLHAPVPRQLSNPTRRSRASQVPKEFKILEDEEPAFQSNGNEIQEQKNRITASTLDGQQLGGKSRGYASMMRRKPSTMRGLYDLDEASEVVPKIIEDGKHTVPSSNHLRHEPRRRTIFVPSDDTTLLTIHPGMKGNRDDPTLVNCSNAKVAQQQFDVAENSKEAVTAQVRRPARTSILAAPRRGPLTMQRQPQPQSSNTVDRNGSLTGKENVAPGFVVEAKSGQMDFRNTKESITSSYVPASANLGTVALAQSASLKVVRKAKQEAFPRTSCRAVEQKCREKVVRSTSSAQTSRKGTLKKPRLDLRDYPPLQEEIAHAQLFEESWLANQEHVLVELINDVFSRSAASRQPPKHTMMRGKLLQLYQDRSTLKLHQRLQASLQFGTLSLPKELDCRNEAYRYTTDVGRRQRFIKLWTQTYTPSFLRPALEAVIGRQIKGQDNGVCSSRDLTLFIEGFLLCNEDSTPPAHLKSEQETAAWAWRRTMSRSLMLIYILDRAKETLMLNGNLMRNNSACKTSTASLSELSDILHPSERNVHHCLSHLGYKVTHEQHPLADYSWPISNLAIDLRDGIRLAWLIELLLPPWQPVEADFDRRPSWSSIDRSTEDPYSTSRYITPHMRVPCSSRTAMVANNELVLQALRDSHLCDAAVQGIQAADLVDGHRERTLALLWGILGTAGLRHLVDWSDVQSEIIRLGGHAGLSQMTGDDSTDVYHQGLLQWASLIASRQELAVTNTSSAFADGTIFEAIVDAYAPLIPTTGSMPRSASSSTAQTLETKLLNLGSSPSFVFGRLCFVDHDFVHATLLFLAARLLPASRPERVRRDALKRLASDCATVVQTRTRLEEAARTLQKCWRDYRIRRVLKEEKKKGEESRTLSGVLEKEVDVDFWMV